MNYNIFSYCIYLPVTYFITFRVGAICYRNGAVYLEKIINDRHEFVQSINSILLAGYYLLNIGYATLVLSTWEQVQSLTDLVFHLSRNIGYIVFLLGLLHYNNMLLTYLYSKYLNKKQQLKQSLS